MKIHKGFLLIFLSLILILSGFACKSSKTKSDHAASQTAHTSEHPGEIENTEDFDPISDEALRTDRFMTYESGRYQRNIEEEKIREISEEKQCKKVLPPCIASCRGGKFIRYITFKFFTDDTDNCETHCRKVNNCQLPD